MFNCEADSGSFSVGLCIFLLITAPLESLLAGVLIGESLEKLFSITADDRVAGLLLGYLLFPMLGFIIGYGTQVAIPRAYYSGGLWVWTAPTAVLLWGILDQFTRNPHEIISFFVPPRGDEGLVAVFVVWPMIATFLYSVGILVANRPPKTAAGAAVRLAVVRSPLTKLARMF